MHACTHSCPAHCEWRMSACMSKRRVVPDCLGVYVNVVGGMSVAPVYACQYSMHVYAHVDAHVTQCRDKGRIVPDRPDVFILPESSCEDGSVLNDSDKGPQSNLKISTP